MADLDFGKTTSIFKTKTPAAQQSSCRQQVSLSFRSESSSQRMSEPPYSFLFCNGEPIFPPFSPPLQVSAAANPWTPPEEAPFSGDDFLPGEDSWSFPSPLPSSGIVREVAEESQEESSSPGDGSEVAASKVQWTREEDRLLKAMVEKYGAGRWSQIAKSVPGRNGKQCRERWRYHVCPTIKKEAWTEEEDKLLVEAHQKHGNRWSEISKRIPGRSDNSIKNHWNSALRKYKRRKECRVTYSVFSKSTILEDYISSLDFDGNSSMLNYPPEFYAYGDALSSHHASTSSNEPSRNDAITLHAAFDGEEIFQEGFQAFFDRLGTSSESKLVATMSATSTLSLQEIETPREMPPIDEKCWSFDEGEFWDR